MIKIKNILLSCVFIFGSLSLSGCYTQLSMFHPEVETDSEEFQLYSVARVRPNISLHAQDGAGQSLGMAYQMMYNRFSGFMGFGNRYSYYNPYYYGGIYNDYVSYNIYDGTYTIWIPGIKEKKQALMDELINQIKELDPDAKLVSDDSTDALDKDFHIICSDQEYLGSKTRGGKNSSKIPGHNWFVIIYVWNRWGVLCRNNGWFWFRCLDHWRDSANGSNH